MQMKTNNLDAQSTGGIQIGDLSARMYICTCTKANVECVKQQDITFCRSNAKKEDEWLLLATRKIYNCAVALNVGNINCNTEHASQCTANVIWMAHTYRPVVNWNHRRV